MRLSIRILLVSLTNAVLVFAVGCQNRAPSLRMLDARSGYNSSLEDEEVALYQKGRESTDTLVRKSAPRIARVYIYPHELPTKDYFWGGYVSVVVSADEWITEGPKSSSDLFSDPSESSFPAIQSLPAAAPSLKESHGGKKI